MEVLSPVGSFPPHDDAPMDLSTGKGRMRHPNPHHYKNDHHQPFLMTENPWKSLADASRYARYVPKADPPDSQPSLLSPPSDHRLPPPPPPSSFPTPTFPSSRYIPIPKKRYSLARASTPTTSSDPMSLNLASYTGYSPPSASDCPTFSSLPPESARKRARLETSRSISPTSSVDERGHMPPATVHADAKNSTSVITCCKGLLVNGHNNCNNNKVNSFGGQRRHIVSGEELSGRGTDEKVVARGSSNQSAMRQRQKHRLPSNIGASSSAGTSLSGMSGIGGGGSGVGVGGGGFGVGGDGSDRGSGDDNQGNQHLLNALMQLQATSQTPTEFLPPSAIKDTEALLSAMRQSQILYYTYCSQLIQNLRAKQLQSQAHLHAQVPRQEHTSEDSGLDCDMEEKHSNQDDLLSKSSEDFEEDAREEDTTEDEDHLTSLNSILRMRLNTQESLDSPISPAASPSGTLPSSTTGGDDYDYSPSEASGRARKRAPRALTGKHVRPGTGASATTLLTLRQKLEERQKYREQYGTDPPLPTKSKGKSKKR
ncbi:uncharacterized protein LOC135206957 [Macrobrachium nipponense]|uniref:uncharacterized protein LOC135206957 n=1 Tax=Macrobrachium nipponense TaxID=159736 RepID=UPI0030C7F073